ncbi:MAG: IS110 family transposase [Burkholderiales bacterium]|jgi:transposase|nr:IS110 family transposase [Burkholderiales bacterium]MDP2399069.1 IS110 family transposase [Burkholderiales bacterium]MDP3715369.1 IS110 family transposase [Burkholderiales bacterium]
MKIKRIGLDLAKQVFQVHGVDGEDRVALKRQLRRQQMLAFFSKIDPCLIGMEACGGAHYWGRELMKLGHTVRLMAPQHVKPYVKGNKNDMNDAEAICEAVGRPNMRFVAVKTVAQQDLQSCHRVRTLLVRQRTAKANEIRGLLGEYGIVVLNRIESLRRALPVLLESTDSIPGEGLRQLLMALREDLVYLDERVRQLDQVIERAAREDTVARRLQQIPGIGPVTATALVASVGDARQFRRARDMSAWLGLVPRQQSSGGKAVLQGISKRGDAYLRTLLIHGARSVARVASRKTDARSQWVDRISQRRHANIAAVALANKNARIAWALMTRGTDYVPQG